MNSKEGENYFHSIEITPDSINHQKEELINSVRDYSMNQVELWKQIPRLALEADGRSGWSDQYYLAYARKLWRLMEPPDSPATFVFLVTGDIVHRTQRDLVHASENSVLQLAANIDALDAQQIVTRLKNQIDQPHESYMDKEKSERYRQQNREQYNP
jgi:hypothetical protein